MIFNYKVMLNVLQTFIRTTSSIPTVSSLNKFQKFEGAEYSKYEIIISSDF